MSPEIAGLKFSESDLTDAVEVEAGVTGSDALVSVWGVTGDAVAGFADDGGGVVAGKDGDASICCCETGWLWG